MWLWEVQEIADGFVRANGGGGPIGSHRDLKPNSPALILNVQCLTSGTGLKLPLAGLCRQFLVIPVP